MTQDEIIEMAQECKLIGMRPHLDGIYSEALIAFANLVAAKALAQPELNPERFNNWTDMDNIKDHVRILEQRVDFMRERIEAMQKQEPMAWAVKTIGGYKWHSIHASKGASDKWLEYRIKEQAQGEEYEQVALYTKDAL